MIEQLSDIFGKLFLTFFTITCGIGMLNVMAAPTSIWKKEYAKPSILFAAIASLLFLVLFIITCIWRP